MTISKILFSTILCTATFLTGYALTPANSHSLLVATKPSAAVQPTMYGIFFEDINYGADGGLYAELIANRTFECPNALASWDILGNVRIAADRPAFTRNPHYAVLEPAGHIERVTMLENHGYFGIPLKKGLDYSFSLYARVNNGGTSKLAVQLLGKNGRPVAEDTIIVEGTPWKHYALSLTSKVNDAEGFLRIFLTSPQGVDIDHVSLMPGDNWNGLRRDLVNDLKDLHPGVFRFPGGCVVEGADLQTRYEWKNTVGDAENRPHMENRWAFSYKKQFFPSYFQTLGLGFYEYFLLSEYIGAEPLPVLNCGMACQYQNRNMKNMFDANVPLEEMQPYIDDALDLVEFANGPVTSQWGALRAKMGHPEPFKLKYIAIGNEQRGPLYPERLEVIAKALRAKYPDINIVGSSGPSPAGDHFDNGWKEMTRLKMDLVDEHFYKGPEWFYDNARRYDNYNRKGPKVFAGEYACKNSGRKNNFETALAEAAFMTGMERNADVVWMATYAPLFANIKGAQWSPDLIWFDNTRSVRTVNWYVQQMFAANVGTNLVSITENGKDLAGEDSLYVSATYDKASDTYIVKMVNSAAVSKNIDISFDKPTRVMSMKRTTLTGNKTDENTLDHPDNILPVDSPAVTVLNGKTSITLAPQSLSVLTFLR